MSSERQTGGAGTPAEDRLNDREFIRRLFYDEGLGQTKIANRIGTEPHKVKNSLVRFGCVRPGQEMLDEDELRETYERTGSMKHTAEELETGHKTVRKYLNHYEIEIDHSHSKRTKEKRLREPAPFFHPQGYEAWGHEDGNFMVHRLLAVAEFGFDAVAGKMVHHRNGIRWDNRIENLRVRDQGQHIHEHLNTGGLEDLLAEESSEAVRAALEESRHSHLLAEDEP